ITDALLGAAALGDIGEFFPDTDPANKNRDSSGMLRQAADLVSAAGYDIVNLDCIVFAERPKLSPYKNAIECYVAEVLLVSPGQVSIKAKTGEGTGEIDREESIEAQCVVLRNDTNDK